MHRLINIMHNTGDIAHPVVMCTRWGGEWPSSHIVERVAAYFASDYVDDWLVTDDQKVEVLWLTLIAHGVPAQLVRLATQYERWTCAEKFGVITHHNVRDDVSDFILLPADDFDFVIGIAGRHAFTGGTQAPVATAGTQFVSKIDRNAILVAKHEKSYDTGKVITAITKLFAQVPARHREIYEEDFLKSCMLAGAYCFGDDLDHIAITDDGIDLINATRRSAHITDVSVLSLIRQVTPHAAGRTGYAEIDNVVADVRRRVVG